jgi:hypothetical protein
MLREEDAGRLRALYERRAIFFLSGNPGRS